MGRSKWHLVRGREGGSEGGRNGGKEEREEGVEGDL